jgi:hypothetical protein
MSVFARFCRWFYVVFLQTFWGMRHSPAQMQRGFRQFLSDWKFISKRDTLYRNLGRGGRCTKFEVNRTNIKWVIIFGVLSVSSVHVELDDRLPSTVGRTDETTKIWLRWEWSRLMLRVIVLGTDVTTSPNIDLWQKRHTSLLKIVLDKNLSWMSRRIRRGGDDQCLLTKRTSPTDHPWTTTRPDVPAEPQSEGFEPVWGFVYYKSRKRDLKTKLMNESVRWETKS